MKFNGIRTNAGKGPKYMHTLPFTIIASELIAPASTPTSPRRRCSACESYASPSHSLTNTRLPPLVAIIQITTLIAIVNGSRRGEETIYQTTTQERDQMLTKAIFATADNTRE